MMTVLPQITALDGVSIEISERILAKQRWQEICESIMREEEEYLHKREREKQEVKDAPPVTSTTDCHVLLSTSLRRSRLARLLRTRWS